MPNKFQIIEVPADAYTELEQMGTKFKFWYRDKDYGYCLFKEGHPNTGEDWAERVVSELCELIELPHAIYKLAVWQERNGVITPNFLNKNERYAAGNEVLFRLDSSYPKEERKAKKHTITTIFDAFELLNIQLPKGVMPPEIKIAKQVFLGYLMLDAWIGNTDRHHENWAVVQSLENGMLTNRLAPTHDHAASLGSILQDNVRNARLKTKDKGYSVEAYTGRGRSAIFENETDKKTLLLIDAFRIASSLNPDASKLWLQKLENVTILEVIEIFERVPNERISDEAKQFAVKLLEINRERLLNL